MLLLAVLVVAADVLKAEALLREGRVSEALQEMRAALAESPGDPEIQYRVGEILREQASLRAARLEELAPDSAEVQELLGRSFEARGKLDEALAAYRLALVKKPALPGVRFLIGNVLWKRRDLEGARGQMEAELGLNPNHALANLRLGQILLASGEAGSAVGRLRDAVRADGSSIEAHRALGKAYRAVGNAAAALPEFQFVAERLPRDGSAHFQLAAVYRLLGNVERANAELEVHRRILRERTSPGAAR